jgi:flagellar hook-associated protein FlgK
MTLSPTGSSKYTTDVSGGKLGGLFSLKNSILRDIDTKLDNLAVGLISEMNNIHVRGVGTSGSFTELTGWAMTSQSLSEFSPAVSDGTINIRVIDSSGNVTRSSYTVTAASDTMTDIRDWLGGLTGISNTNTVITDAKLHIEAESGYKFDFLGGAMTSPPAAGADNTMAGFGANAAPEVHISGNYTGTANETYTFTVATSPAGQTGLTIGSGSMAVEVRNGAGSLVKTISVGSGYVAGTAVPIENGISVSFDANGSSPGYLNDGELFRITAVADSDTSGVLAAMGINAFFSGSNSESIAVCDRIKASTSALAVYGHAEPTETGERITGNENLVAMSRLGDAAMTSLGGLSPKEYYRTLATDIGKDIAITEIKHDNALGVWQNMRDQRDGISGVDLNTEATRMLVFERMFQSMAKYLNTISKSQDTLMSIIY